MITFDVKDMTCGHCVATITKAVQAADPQARVDIDLAAHRVRIEPAEADEQALAAAIREAGYSPVPVSSAASPAAAKQGGCCGG
jgi:copper chaperone